MPLERVKQLGLNALVAGVERLLIGPRLDQRKVSGSADLLEGIEANETCGARQPLIGVAVLLEGSECGRPGRSILPRRKKRHVKGRVGWRVNCLRCGVGQRQSQADDKRTIVMMLTRVL